MGLAGKLTAYFAQEVHHESRREIVDLRALVVSIIERNPGRKADQLALPAQAHEEGQPANRRVNRRRKPTFARMNRAEADVSKDARAADLGRP